MRWLKAILAGLAVVALQTAAWPVAFKAGAASGPDACGCGDCRPRACCCVAQPEPGAPVPFSASIPSSVHPDTPEAPDGPASLLPRALFTASVSANLPEVDLPQSAPLFAQYCARLI